jgi:hypothetical protein
MSVFYELFALEENVFYTGSFSPPADHAGNGGLNVMPGQSMQTGSWYGLANTWGATNTLSTNLSSSLMPGHWWGIDVSWGTYHIPTESIDRNDVISNAFPHPDQGLAMGDWDPFPIPPPPPVPVLPPRDLTRYRKAYSSQRSQPVRIRLVRS